MPQKRTVFIALLCVMCGCILFYSPDPPPPLPTPGGATEATIKASIEYTKTMALQGVASKEEFRSQVKVLALTVFFAVIGISFTKDAEKHRGFLIGVACIANLGFYGMDTYLLDLMYRETALAGKMSEYLLQWDMLNAEQMNRAYQIAMKGLDPSSPERKFLLAIGFDIQEWPKCPWKPRKVDWLWYGGPAAAVLLWTRIYVRYPKWRRERGWDVVLQQLRDFIGKFSSSRRK